MTEEWLRKSLDAASNLYDFQADHLEKFSGGYENKMYGFRTPSRKVVIRITPPGHKSVREVEAEIHWLNYLNQNGAPVVKVLESNNRNLVEVIETNQGEVPVVCFGWAEGRVVRKEDFSESLFHTWGRAVGKMHALTKDYRPRTRDRIQWENDEYLCRNLIPTTQTKVLERFDALMDYFKKLPRGRDSFGLIHQDVHHENLILDGNKLTVLDFDDSAYGFFVFDIANALGFSIWEKPENMSNREFADFYLEHFMKGYEEENHLEDSWTEHLPYALKLFEFIHYNAFNMDYDLAGKGRYKDLPERTKMVLTRYRNSIEENLPYVENTFCPYR
jgi:Ser/Thr protein kinase RdoA (MazF antagonist)